MKEKIKILIICGPTATGKSALAVELARRFDGEVISADSRQVYRGLTIGTGKITKREMRGVPHHLLDVADPSATGSDVTGSAGRFIVEQFQKMAQKKIVEIAARGHLPILCGGTGFYIQAVVDDVTFPDVPPNIALRKRMEKKNVATLFTIIKKLDPKRAKTIDPHNPRRLVRAIEIATALGNVPTLKKIFKKSDLYDPLFIGITLPDEELKRKIRTRLLSRMRAGMVAEVRRLHQPKSRGGAGLSWRRMNELGLEYRYLALYLQKIPPCETRAKLVEKLSTEIWRYARRQKTWFKRDKRIAWFAPNDKTAIATRIRKFLNN